MTVGYRPSGGRVTLTRNGAGTTSLGVDNALRLSDFIQNFTGTANDLTNTFGYNAVGQVKWIDQSNTQYTYTESQSLLGRYVPNGLNQYTSIGGQTIAYDANGNLTHDGSISYTYDMENRLVATTGGVASTFTYDPLGRLYQTVIAGTTRRFLYDGDALVGEYDGSNVLVRRFIHGDGDDEVWVQYNGANLAANIRRFLYADHQGSIIAQTDGSGAVVATLAYDGFGIPATANVGRFGYTGQAWLKELGLFHYKARMYSPRLGRFLQTDPVGYDDDLNLYAYVYNDPLNRTDPTGNGAVKDFLYGMGRGAFDADSEHAGITSEEFDASLDDKGVDRESFWFDVGHAVGESTMRPPDEVGGTGSSRPSMGVNGNDHRARRPQHGYVIRDTRVKNPKGKAEAAVDPAASSAYTASKGAPETLDFLFGTSDGDCGSVEAAVTTSFRFRAISRRTVASLVASLGSLGRPRSRSAVARPPRPVECDHPLAIVKCPACLCAISLEHAESQPPADRLNPLQTGADCPTTVPHRLASLLTGRHGDGVWIQLSMEAKCRKMRHFRLRAGTRFQVRMVSATGPEPLGPITRR